MVLSGTLPFHETQRPLGAPKEQVSPKKGGPVYWQDDRTCRANTSHFTGNMPVSADKNLFYCKQFTTIRGGGARDAKTILWLNGGPGASSLPGLFTEIGPCEFDAPNSTVVNPDSWVDFANLLFLDQPAGVGFSTAGGDSAPVTLGEASDDFSAFLVQFVHAFPEYFRQGLYIAGESFGGRYVPRFTADIIHNKALGKFNNLALEIKGIALFNALVDAMYTLLGHYELFCTDHYQEILRFNRTACAEISAATTAAETMKENCQTTLDPAVCRAAQEYATENIYKFFQEEVDALRHSPYDLRLGCERPPICIPPSEFSVEPYLNSPEIQSLLGIAKPVKYEPINFPLNSKWGAQSEISIPTGMNISYILNSTNLRLLVVNGNLDVST
ncbi:alpha/beta-hydrolase [Thozetella sp. PMI_491]|nr:alpha/beta-hydrolase [Thozetella sp. PMI_491]